MADFSKFSLYGTVYNVKDTTARTNAQAAQSTADLALTGANNISYDSETIIFTRVGEA